MQISWKRLWVSAAVGAALLVLGAVSATAGSDEHKANACGCYQKFDGSCVCGRGSKCGCPEECEPKGCEEKRQKEMDKEIQAETKKAQDNEKKRNEEAAAKVKAQEKTFVDDGENEGSTAEAEEPAPAPKDKSKKSSAKQDKQDKDKQDKKERKEKKEAK